MKLFQYDTKTWDNGEVSHTYQFGIIKNTSLLYVFYETPGGITYSSGGINVLLSFFGHSLFCVSIQQYKFGFALGILSKYFDGWDETY